MIDKEKDTAFHALWTLLVHLDYDSVLHLNNIQTYLTTDNFEEANNYAIQHNLKTVEIDNFKADQKIHYARCIASSILKRDVN